MTRLAADALSRKRHRLSALERLELLVVTGRRRAVIVGVNGCSNDPSIPVLKYAEADAIAMHQALIDRQTGTFDPDDVAVFTGAQATADAITAALRQIALEAEASDVLLVFFAGHGYLAPWDAQHDVYLATADFSAADVRLLPDRGLRMRLLRQDVFEISKGSTFLVLDCCHAGGYASGSSARAGAEALLRALESHETQLSQHTALMACPHDQKTRESAELQHGNFSYALLQGLNGAAAGGDGQVTFSDLATFVKQQEISPKVGLFARDWGPTIVLTRPKLSRGRSGKTRTRVPEVKLVGAANPMDQYTTTIRQLSDRMFRDRKATARVNLSRVDRVAQILEAESTAVVELSAAGTMVKEASTGFQLDDFGDLLTRVGPRITEAGRTMLGHLAIEEGGRQVLAVPLTRDSRDSVSMLVVTNAAKQLLALGEPLAEMMRVYLKADLGDPALAEIEVLTALRRTFGRIPLDLYQDCFNLYSDLLKSVVMVFEPVLALNKTPRGIGVHSYEALARRNSTSKGAPLQLLESAHAWGDQFIVERDTALAVKAVHTYADAFDRSEHTGLPKPVSINVAVRTLLSDAYIDTLHDAILEAGLAAGNVTLEISERDPIAPAADERWLPDATTFFRDRMAAITRKCGLHFAVDDFGVAHASLDRLSTLSLTQIKVDRAILRHDADLAKEELSLVVRIARHALQQQAASAPRAVVVEGVDDQVKLSLLDIFRCGIGFVQGYITELPASADLAVAGPELKARLAAKVRGEL